MIRLPSLTVPSTPKVEFCELDSKIMDCRVARVTTGPVTVIEGNKILSHLKNEQYNLVYWNSHGADSELVLRELPYRRERYGKNVLYMLPVVDDSSYPETTLVTLSPENVSSEELEKLLTSCTRYSHLLKDPRINNAHVYRLFDCWFQDGIHRSNNRNLLILGKDNQCFGMAVYTVDDQLLYINLFAVSENFQHKGYGTRLIHAILAEAQRKKCAFAALITQEENSDSRRFYKTVGFEEQYSYDIYHFWF